MLDPQLEAMFGRRVRVKRPLPECGPRRFMWCELRPEPCHVHGYRHDGDLECVGHFEAEAGVCGEIAAHLGGMNDGHPWIVRYDWVVTIDWPAEAPGGPARLRVNSGTYRLDELELL
jgi:hypothetical protein